MAIKGTLINVTIKQADGTEVKLFNNRFPNCTCMGYRSMDGEHRYWCVYSKAYQKYHWLSYDGDSESKDYAN